MEAAANTVEHAYKEKQRIQTINKWWLTASLNTSTGEISFIFYDQGLGHLLIHNSNLIVRLRILELAHALVRNGIQHNRFR
jgi:hypothetical protein